MSVFEMAKYYYERKLWDKPRLDALLAAEKLTQQEYNSLVKE